MSEAQLGVEAEEIRPCSDVVGLSQETIRPKGARLASVGSVGRFGDSRKTTSRKGGDFWSAGGRVESGLCSNFVLLQALSLQLS